MIPGLFLLHAVLAERRLKAAVEAAHHKRVPFDFAIATLRADVVFVLLW